MPYQRNWLDKLITHDRDKVGDFGSRVVLHIPVGFLIGVSFPLSYPLLKTIHKYERNEDAHTEDEAWKDLFGVMAGEVIGMLVEIASIIFLLKLGGLI